MRAILVLVVSLLVVPAVIGPAGGAPPSGIGSPFSHGAAESTSVASQSHADPDEDVIGWENGYWHNESIDVDQSDGLSDEDLDAYVSRAMARVEVLRDLEFMDDVEVEIMTRSEYRAEIQDNTSASYSAWNNQVWEALFLVDEETDVTDEFVSISGGSVTGFYAVGRNHLVIVSEDEENPVINNATLIHELTHALQDQHFNLSQRKYQGETQDSQLAADGLVEGEANYIERLYAERCGVDWECVDSPESSGSGGGEINFGVFITIFQPYSDGPEYINQLIQEGDWEPINEIWESPPQSTEQIIHPDRSDEPPEQISFEDTATNGWTEFPEQGVNGTDTVGETSIFSMFWFQNFEYGIETILWQSLLEAQSQFDTYNYESSPSAGWGNDRIIPYQNNGEYGYVWLTVWDTREDAIEFEAAYRDLLVGHGAEAAGTDTWVIPVGGFADAFHVSREGARVKIVNAPRVEDLQDIRPGITIREPETAAPPFVTTIETSDSGDERTPSLDNGETSMRPATEPGVRDDPESPSSETTGQPGFGIPVAFVALVLLTLGVLSRNRRKP